MAQYALDNYGDALYGDVVSSQVGAVRKLVGLEWDVALAAVGLKLAPGNKAYDKHGAQTFSYNPKSLFKQGNGASLNPTDLYFWNRLQHNRWDGGETYEPWAPDPSQGNQTTKYADSRGFDTTDPHKLSHLRDVFTSPSYEYVVGTDSPLAYWLLGDVPIASPTTGGIPLRPWWRRGGIGILLDSAGNTVSTVIDQIGNATPGTPGLGTAFGLTPGPIVQESKTVAGFNGTQDGIYTVNKVPFAGGLTPTDLWSLEAWAMPQVLPQNGVIVMLGSEPSATPGNYKAAVEADSPSEYLQFEEAAGTTAVADVGTNGSVWGGVTVNQTGQIGKAYAFDGAGGSVVDFAYNLTTAVSLEAWVKPTAYATGGVDWAPGGGIVLSIGQYAYTGVQMFVKNSGHLAIRVHNGGGSGEVLIYDSGVSVPLNQWSHIVATVATNGDIRLYVNGADSGLVANHAVVLTASSGYIGNAMPQVSGDDHSGADSGFIGLIDEPAIYNAVLTLTQIHNHYVLGGGGGVTPGGFGFGVGDGAGGSGSKLVGRFPGAAAADVDSTYTFPSEATWYHIVLTYDGVNLKFYVNGALKSTIASTPQQTKAIASIGMSHTLDVNDKFVGSSRLYTGEAAQVAVYHSTLSLARIQAHYNQGTQAAGSTMLTVGQSYAKFIELYNGDFYVNQQNTNIAYSTDGGNGWATVALPGGDVTTIAAIWSKGSKVYVATATNVYLGDRTGFASFNGGNPAIAGVTAGIWYSGQLYVGIGTSLYYVDPATGIKTQLYNTNDFTITFIEAFAGKIWFGGVNGRVTKVWTWTNNTLPPSAANGSGAQVQEGTIPYGFVVRSSLVYLNMLLLGGTTCADTTSEGQGTVYYITPAGQFGQLCILGPLMNQIKGTGLDYGVKSMWGAEDKLWMGSSHGVGISRYNFATGGFSKHVHTDKYPSDPGNQVIAVAYFVGHAFFAVKKDGNIWRESVNKAPVAWLETSEFLELPFTDKLIDGVEGTMAPLNSGEILEIQISTDNGVSWQSMGRVIDAGLWSFDLQFSNVLTKHWRSRLYSYPGIDQTKAPEIYNWSERFTPTTGDKHEWVIQAVLPTISRNRTGGVHADAGAKLLKQLWSAKESKTAVDFIDRDGVEYKVMVIELKEEQPTQRQAKVSAQQLRLDSIITVELLEVQRIG